MKEIKFRALLTYNDGCKIWEYYTTLSQPAWLDFQDVEITVKDLQYIGWTDKNNKEIYEADIVKWHHPDFKEFFIDIIKYDEAQGCYMLGNSYFYEAEDFEIIGNKFENPELLQNPIEEM